MNGTVMAAASEGTGHQEPEADEPERLAAGEIERGSVGVPRGHGLFLL